MMYWNVTYNDPNRWKAVYKASGGRLPWWRGVLACVVRRRRFLALY